MAAQLIKPYKRDTLVNLLLEVRAALIAPSTLRLG